MQNQFFDIILFAMVAGFIAFRLYTVLGRRTGHERAPDEQVRVPDPARAAPQPKDNVIPLPDRGGQAAAAAAAVTPLARALLDIKLADRNFDETRFIGGARAAHEMIVTAFAKGDRDTLKPLLSDEVFATFDAEIRGREQRRERMDFSVAGLKSSRFTNAELKGRMAEVTVGFESDIISARYDSAGKLIEGDAKIPHTVTDIWTFARDTSARDPNWKLVATASG